MIKFSSKQGKKIVNADFCKRIRKLRQNKKLYLKDVAKALNISTRTYSRYESERDPGLPSDPNIIVGLSEVLGTTTDYILTGKYGTQMLDEGEKEYLDIHARYSNDEEFHYLLNALLKVDKALIASFSDVLDKIDLLYKLKKKLS